MPDEAPHGAPTPTPTPDPPPKAPEEPQDAPEAVSNGHAPPSVLDALREQYAAADGDRTTTLLIVPGRFNSSLAAKYRPIPWTEQRRKVRNFSKQGENEESELNYGAAIIAEACQEILVCPAPGAPLEPMHKVVDELKGPEPIRYDSRLARAIGIPAEGLDSKAIVRAVFLNEAALNAHFAELEAFQREATSGDEDDEERPT